MAPRKHITVRTTLLVVVEGDTEFAFCRYLKMCFSPRQALRAGIKSAHGGSPDKIVEYARRQMRQFPHDILAVVFDADRPLSQKSAFTLQKLKARTFRFTPCIEGFFLELLGHPKPADSDSCKQTFHRVGLDEKAKLSHASYARLFPVEEMNRWRKHNDFDRLVRLFLNEKLPT